MYISIKWQRKRWGSCVSRSCFRCFCFSKNIFLFGTLLQVTDRQCDDLVFMLTQDSRKEAKEAASKGQRYLHWSWLWQEWRRRKGRSPGHPEDQSLHRPAWPAAESAPSLVVAGWIWRGRPSWRALRSPVCCSDSCGSSASQASMLAVKFTKVWTFDQKTP